MAVATELERRIVKTFKCPVCGGTFELQFDLASYDYREATYEQVYYYVCDTCALTSDWQFIEDEARKKLEALIRRFPPLMRVWPGDVVSWGVHPVTVLDKDVQCGELLVLDSYGNKQLLEQRVIDKWPWELEQEKEERNCYNCKYSALSCRDHPCNACSSPEAPECYKYWEAEPKEN
jgi:hypothetical protein